MVNPYQLLEAHSDGGALMIFHIRDLVGSDPATPAPALQLLANATNNQKSAIGTGLGQAAICVRTSALTFTSSGGSRMSTTISTAAQSVGP